MKWKRKHSKHRVTFEQNVLLTAMMHFPNLDPEEMDCEHCEDLRARVCDGRGLRGEEVIECMAHKVLLGIG